MVEQIIKARKSFRWTLTRQELTNNGKEPATKFFNIEGSSFRCIWLRGRKEMLLQQVVSSQPLTVKPRWGTFHKSLMLFGNVLLALWFSYFFSQFLFNFWLTIDTIFFYNKSIHKNIEGNSNSNACTSLTLCRNRKLFNNIRKLTVKGETIEACRH